MGCKKSRNDLTQKSSLSTTSIRTSTTNPRTTSNSTNSIDNIFKSNPTIKAKNTTNQNMPDTSDSDLDTSPDRSLRIFNVMPHSEQPDAPCFDDKNVTEFLRRWNIECEDAEFINPQKCDRLPYYCTEQVQSVVELLDGYIDKNWDGLQTNLKEQYWQNDTQKNTSATLNQLIRDVSILDLSIYVLKYTSITKALIANNEMSIMQHCRRFLDGLSEHLRYKAFDFCIIND